MTQAIDFLPQDYRQHAAETKGQLWHVLVVVLFGGAICAAALSQWVVRRQVATESALVEVQYQAAVRQQAELESLRAELKQTNSEASLHAYLRHPWPRTQILCALTANVPDSIRLTELSIGHEQESAASNSRSASTSQAAGDLADPSQQQQRDGPSQDLDALAQECDARRTVAIVSGRASNITELHDYVERIEEELIVERVGFSTLEGQRNRDGDSSEFQLRVEIAHPYGHPSRPRSAPEGSLTAQTR